MISRNSSLVVCSFSIAITFKLPEGNWNFPTKPVVSKGVQPIHRNSMSTKRLNDAHADGCHTADAWVAFRLFEASPCMGIIVSTNSRN